jgi:hypothetical protein
VQVAMLGPLEVVTVHLPPRRHLILVTLAAAPRRGQVLAAKAVVTGAVTFAAVLAVAAVIALAIAAILRRGAGAVAVVVVLPYMFSVAAPILPPGPTAWLLRLTPAAGFAVQGTLIQYPQVSNTYTAAYGYYPLPPWQASPSCAPGAPSP